MLKLGNKCWVRVVLLQHCVLGELAWLKSQDGSVSPCTNARACGRLKWLLKYWCLFSRQSYMFLLLLCHFGYVKGLLCTWGLGISMSRRWHLWWLSLSTENRKPPVLNQCHCNTIYQTWMVKWNTALSITELSCCPSLRKATGLKSEFFYCSTGGWHYLNFF